MLQILHKYHTSIIQYYTNAMQLVYKYLTNIMQILYKYYTMYYISFSVAGPFVPIAIFPLLVLIQAEAGKEERIS